MLDLPRDRLLSTTDVAKVLGVSRDTVLRAIHGGSLAALSIALNGRPRLRVHPDDLNAWIEARRQPRKENP